MATYPIETWAELTPIEFRIAYLSAVKGLSRRQIAKKLGLESVHTEILYRKLGVATRLELVLLVWKP
jgi:DNA-binding NarL/FixJ family response regulator